MYYTTSTDWATIHTLSEVVPLCRGAVGVFYNLNILGYNILLGRGLTPLQRCCRCILQPQPTGSQDTHWARSYPSADALSVYSTTPANWATGHSLGGVLPLCRGAVGVFYNPTRLGHNTLIGRDFTPLQRCCRCIVQPQHTGSKYTHWARSYPSVEVLLVCSTTPSDRDTGHSLGEVLLLCRGAVGVFYNPTRLGHNTLIGRGLTPLQRCCRCFLQPHPTGPQDTHWAGCGPSTEEHLVYSTALADWATGHSLGGVWSLYRGTLGVFYWPTADWATIIWFRLINENICYTHITSIVYAQHKITQ